MSKFDRIIFLDVDGVLNDAQSVYDTTKYRIENKIRTHRLQYMIRPEFVERLNQVIKATDAGIVLSSTYRKTHVARLAVARSGIYEYRKRFLGCTPSGNRYDPTSHIRGLEIKQWLEDNKYTGKFVILDDDSDMGELMPYLVQTRWGTKEERGGLTEEKTQETIDFLMK